MNRETYYKDLTLKTLEGLNETLQDIPDGTDTNAASMSSVLLAQVSATLYVGDQLSRVADALERSQ